MLDNLMGILMSIKVTDVIDIVIVSYLLYRLLGFIKETRAQQLFRGILLIIAFFLISEVFNLSLLNWLFTRLVTVGLIAVVILFQPEIRRGLEQIGRRGVLSWQFRDISKVKGLLMLAKCFLNIKVLISFIKRLNDKKEGRKRLANYKHKSYVLSLINS